MSNLDEIKNIDADRDIWHLHVYISAFTAASAGAAAWPASKQYSIVTGTSPAACGASVVTRFQDRCLSVF